MIQRPREMWLHETSDDASRNKMLELHLEELGVNEHIIHILNDIGITQLKHFSAYTKDQIFQSTKMGEARWQEIKDAIARYQQHGPPLELPLYTTEDLDEIHEKRQANVRGRKPVARKTMLDAKLGDPDEVKRYTEVQCTLCGKTVMAYSTATKYCPECRLSYDRNISRAAAVRQNHKYTLPKNCHYCGVDFIAGNVRAMFCSKECKIKHGVINARKRRKESEATKKAGDS